MIEPIKGVERHQGGLRIVFHWQGKRYRRVATKNDTQRDIKYANKLKQKVESYKNADQNPLSLFVETKGEYRDFERLAHDWLQYRDDYVKDSTLRRNQCTISDFVRIVGNKPIDQITLRDVELYCHTKMKVQGMTYSGLHPHKSALHMFFDWCIYNDFCRKNPARQKQIKRQHTAFDEEEKEILPFDKEEIKKIQAGIMHPRNKFRGNNREQLYNIFMIGLTTGMRPGEMIALQWGDVDFREQENYLYGAVTITKSKSQGQELSSPKTNAGNRKHALSQEARKYFERQRRLTGLVGQHVFCGQQTGKYKNQPLQSSLSLTNRAWRNSFFFIKDVKYRRFYQTRHTYISNLVANGVPYTIIARQVGHASTRILIENYVKVFAPELKNQAKMISEAQKNRI
jgi:integrase